VPTRKAQHVKGFDVKTTKLGSETLRRIKSVEDALREAVDQGDSKSAIHYAAEIQAIFGQDRTHHRLLRAKLWALECCMENDAAKLAYAERGFIGIRALSSTSSKLYLEASGLLALSLIRQKKPDEAKPIIREVISRINNIESSRTRHLFQKRFVERIEEECILAELIGTGDEELNFGLVQAKAIELLQRNTDDEIFKLIGQCIPSDRLLLFAEVRAYSILQLPAPDRALLPPPEAAQEPKTIGRTAFAVLRRVAWKTFCKPSSPIFELWSKKIPKVFNEGYFSAAIISALADLRIGIPLLASGVAAIVMKYSAEEFCALAKPKGIMGSARQDAKS
jgi:hypothetical protein